MAIRIEKANLAYFPVPKVACTTLKKFCYEVINGRPFVDGEASGQKRNIHIHNHDHDYASVEYAELNLSDFEDMIRAAVVRDPISRILSAYSNRVLQQKELSAQKINQDLARELGVSADPDLNTFVVKIDDYRKLSNSIRHHTEPHTSFLGPSLSYFSHVFPIEQIDGFRDLVNRLSGSSLVLHREQRSSQKFHFSDLESRARDSLVRYCHGDYVFLDDFYRVG